jgi:alpha-L-arabinofuranosidase
MLLGDAHILIVAFLLLELRPPSITAAVAASNTSTGTTTSATKFVKDNNNNNVEQQPPPATISVDPHGTAIARMPATHAGLIMEGVNHALYGYGLGSQMLFGEGFEEPSITDCTVHNTACYGPFPEQWSVIGNASLTSTKVFTGKQALRVEGTAQLLNAGLHRLGMATTRGWTYEASFFYQYKVDPPTAKLASKLTLMLRTNEHSSKNLTTVSSVTLAPTGGQWQRINVTLPAASRSFPNCSLSIQIDGNSVLHVDAVLLEPAAEHRWRGMHIRSDIAEAINEAGLRFMRFGGDMAESNEPLPFGYTWANQVGDPQRRPPKLGGAWYAWDSYGFGMFEVLEMIEKMGFGTDRQGSWGVMITLNYKVETPESCALFVEYCFGGSDTKGGAMRIANGRSDPYKPFFIEVGNEQHGKSIQPYLAIFSAQVDAMMAVPSAKGKLKYLVGTSILTTYPDSDIKALFDYCRGKPCGYDWHIGIGNHSDIASQMQSKVDSLWALQQLYQRMGTNKTAFVTIIGEENCDHWPSVGAHPGCHTPSAYYQDHMWGVALNRALEHAAWSNALQSPLGSMILASNPSSATGSWYTHMSNDVNPNGPKIGALWLSANVQYTPTAIVVQPPMHAQSMIGRSQLPNVLHVGRSSTLPSVNLSIAALASDDCDHLTIRVVNLNATAVTAAVAIAGGSTWGGTATQLSGKLDDYNSPKQLHHVVPTEVPVTAGQLAAGFRFDQYSFTVLNLTRLVTDDGAQDELSITSSISESRYIAAKSLP